MRPAPGRVQCACGWAGELPSKASCPSCGERHRLRDGHFKILLELHAGRRPTVQPAQRIWLTEKGLIDPGTRVAPTPERYSRIPARRISLTDRGRLVVASILANQQQPQQETAA